MPIAPRQDPPSGSTRLLAALIVLALTFISGPSGGAFAQAKEWWDLHDDAKRIVESEQASPSELNQARRDLRQALRAKNDEGKFGTYNPTVRKEYLPHFYLGWVNVKLGRYDEAARSLQRSEEIGYITKGAPAALRTRFQTLRQLLAALTPASEALDRARSSSTASQCQAESESAAGRSITESISRLEAILAAPSDPAVVKQWTDTLNTALGECTTEIRGAAIARLVRQYQEARDAVVVEGVGELLTSSTRSQMEGAVQAGDGAEAASDEDGLTSARRTLEGLAGKVTSEVDSSIARIARDAERTVTGNEGALNQQGQIGTRLSTLADRAKGLKAAGKTGSDLAAVVKEGVDLKNVFEQARSALQPMLEAKTAALDGARRDFDTWMRSSSCDINVVEANAEVDNVLGQANTARSSGSADAMDRAVSRLAAVRTDVQQRMTVALPRMEEQARGAAGSAESLIGNIPDAEKRSRGETLKKGVEDAVAQKDVCAIDSAIAALNGWMRRESPQLEAARRAAVSRTQATLDAAQSLLTGFAGILKPATIESLQPPTERLAALIKSSYDAEAIDQAGQGLRPIVERANGEVQGQMQDGIRVLRELKEDRQWAADVSRGRRQWLDANLGRVEQAVSSTSNPELLARFALEYPRARLEMALNGAFRLLYEEDDPAAATGRLEALGPGFRAGSAALNYALAYCYWWQGRSAGSGERDALLEKARAAYDDGTALRVDLASLGAPLFAPAFVQEMTRR